MSSLLRTLCALIVCAIAATAPAAHAADTTASEVQGIISSQIDAFKHQDGAKAYSFASREVQLIFPSVDMFMDMVRTGYAAVYNPQQFQFGPFAAEGDFFKQLVDITAADGTAWTAEYTLSRAPDGTLKIGGCRLIKRPGVGA